MPVCGARRYFAPRRLPHDLLLLLTKMASVCERARCALLPSRACMRVCVRAPIQVGGGGHSMSDLWALRDELVNVHGRRYCSYDVPGTGHSDSHVSGSGKIGGAAEGVYVTDLVMEAMGEEGPFVVMGSMDSVSARARADGRGRGGGVRVAAARPSPPTATTTTAAPAPAATTTTHTHTHTHTHKQPRQNNGNNPRESTIQQQQAKSSTPPQQHTPPTSNTKHQTTTPRDSPATARCASRWRTPARRWRLCR
jgi:hypothetical protein